MLPQLPVYTNMWLKWLNVAQLTIVLVLEIRNKVIEIGIRVLKQIHLNMYNVKDDQYKDQFQFTIIYLRP